MQSPHTTIYACVRACAFVCVGIYVRVNFRVYVCVFTPVFEFSESSAPLCSRCSRVDLVLTLVMATRIMSQGWHEAGPADQMFSYSRFVLWPKRVDFTSRHFPFQRSGLENGWNGIALYSTDSRFAPASERRRYKVTPVLIGWAQT